MTCRMTYSALSDADLPEDIASISITSTSTRDSKRQFWQPMGQKLWNLFRWTTKEGMNMKRIIVAVVILGILFAAGCSATSSKKATDQQATDMKQQLSNTMDKMNAAYPYIVDWSSYQFSQDNARKLKIATEIVMAYPSLKKYLNAQGLFDPANYPKVDKAINTEDPR